ncbi:acetate--CoA ligase family protein [Chloroflexota bacterium]
MEEALQFIFEPRGVVVIGASHKPEKLGYGLARNLILSGYRGATWFVNPKGGTLFGQEIFTDVADIPDPVDLAVLLVPSRAMLKAIRECGERAIKAAIISSGGFGEIGEEGKKLERECLEIARQYGMRLLGPNCIGILDTHLPLDTTFLASPGPIPGNIAFISHSGAMCAAILDWSREEGFGISQMISLGNQIDVDVATSLFPVVNNDHTHAVALYMEGITDGRAFVEQAAKASRIKPIVALKSGRYEGGQKAIASHTGAMAGHEEAFDAAFRRAGVIRAETTEQMFDWARALASSPLPKGRKVAVLTNAGGPGVTAVDALEINGLSLANISSNSQSMLRELLPPVASVNNPIDMLASASPQDYSESLKLILKDSGVDSVLVVLPPPPMFAAAGVANAIIPVIQAAEKPVIVAAMGAPLIKEAVERLRAAKIPEYRFPERAASALAVLSTRTEVLQRDHEVSQFSDIDYELAQEVLEQADLLASGFLAEEDAAKVLEAYCLPVLSMRLASSAEEAVSIAEEIGYPVVMKIAAPEIPHKSDVGGVLLDLMTQDEIKQSFENLMKGAAKKIPDANLQGVYIQKMVMPGQEVIIGAVRDQQFGPLLMFGSGGTEVEGLEDVAFSLAPVSWADIEFMLANTWAGKKLAGFRNLLPADIKSVEEVIIRMGQIAIDFPQIEEMEINPLRVLPKGKGAFALDIRIKINS